MPESFRAHDFIQLPPLGEAGTLTLVEELQAAVAATSGPLGAGVVHALAQLLDAAGELEKQIGARARAGSNADPRARAADRALDDAWGALQMWLLAWTRLPDGAHPRVPDTRALYTALFPKGLSFLTLEFRDEWTESQKRLDAIREHRLAPFLESLGGTPFLGAVAAAHKAYGEALHLTPDTPDPDAGVRQARHATHLALRDYVAQVAATAQRSDATSVARAAALLAPLSARTLVTYADEAHVEDVLDDARSGTMSTHAMSSSLPGRRSR